MITKKQRTEMFALLNYLQDEGGTDMFGLQFELVDEFGIARHESREIVSSWMKEKLMSDCRLKNYRFEELHEEDNMKLWHMMDDQNGVTHALDISPYHTVTPADTKAFSEIAIRLGKVPTKKDNNGINFDSNSIASLLKRLEKK